MSSHGTGSNQFIRLISSELPRDPEMIFHVLDLQNKLRPENYYILDDHVNASGHRLIADELFTGIENF
jgi:hypothetical protein